MKSLLKCIVVLSAFAAGCGSDPDSAGPGPEPTDTRIVFGAASGTSASAGKRSIVGNPQKDGSMENGMMTLGDICTPSVGGRAIAVWGDYCVNSAPKVRKEYVTLFEAAQLVRDPAGESGEWVYDGPARYWLRDCSYRFRAYFPSMIEPVSSSNISTLSLEYPSNRVQEDLLVAYNEADSGSPGFDPSKPVELYFRHTLAALKFKFELDYDNADMITSVWFENGLRDDFAVGGILFCERRESGGRIFSSAEPPAESELDSYFQWLEGYCPEPGVDRFYKWSCTQTGGRYDGLELETKPDESGELKVVKSACAYDSPEEHTAEGGTFIRNGGWLLIIPQESTGNLQLCFRTVHGGSSTVFRVALPKNTGPVLNDDGEYVDAAGRVVPDASQAAQYTRWRAGKRYTYTVRIRRSDLKVSLAVADWNMRYSSTQIEF